MDNDNNTPLLSRTGVVSPLGTLLSELKTKVDIDTELAFRRLCNEADTDVAGALRNYVCKVVHGKTYEELCFEASKRRRALLLPEGPNGGLIT
jgi:hypothetical protein